MLKIKKFLVEMLFWGGGFLHMPFYIHMPNRLDKSRSALAEVRLKTHLPLKTESPGWCRTESSAHIILVLELQ